jgi:predicted aspartyl protease
MGEVRGDFILINPANGKSIELNALVDSGAVVYLADDSTTEMDRVDVVAFKFMNRTTGNPILISDYGVEPLIGQRVLEGLDLLVDCPRHKVIVSPDSPAYPSYKAK